MKPSKQTWRFKKPLVIRRVVGHSMQPTLTHSSLLAFSSLLRPKSGRVILAQVGDKDIVKRLLIDDGKLFLVGDNRDDSLDFEIQPEQILAVALI